MNDTRQTMAGASGLPLESISFAERAIEICWGETQIGFYSLQSTHTAAWNNWEPPLKIELWGWTITKLGL